MEQARRDVNRLTEENAALHDGNKAEKSALLAELEGQKERVASLEKEHVEVVRQLEQARLNVEELTKENAILQEAKGKAASLAARLEEQQERANDEAALQFNRLSSR